jgi:hypothetical protein
MFYRLASIDGAALPGGVAIAGLQQSVARAGLLLEPPPAAGGDGYAVMTFFGSPAPGSGDFIASSAEPYRCAAGTIDISRRQSDLGARFAGTLDARGVRLQSLGGAGFLEPGTLLEFVAAPEEPITGDWSDTFDFGPPHVQAAGGPTADDPEARELVRQWLAAREPERRRAAQVRLARAWHAAPTADPDGAT